LFASMHGRQELRSFEFAERRDAVAEVFQCILSSHENVRVLRDQLTQALQVIQTITDREEAVVKRLIAAIHDAATKRPDARPPLSKDTKTESMRHP
jgi:hypothetical protein